MVFVPDEPEEEHFEGGESSQGEQASPRGMDQLVDDEEREEGERGGIGPELLFYQRPDQDDLCRAVEEEVRGPDVLQVGREVRERRRGMAGKEIVRILDKLVRGGRGYEGTDPARDEQKRAQADLESGAQGLEAEARHEYDPQLLFVHTA